MPLYQNYRNREVTVFLGNARPVKFMPGEYKEIPSEGLEKLYASYIRKVDMVKESSTTNTPPPANKGVISEVKQPEPDKELIKEPVKEADKKGGKKVLKESPKLSEGYSPWSDESTIASAGRQGND